MKGIARTLAIAAVLCASVTATAGAVPAFAPCASGSLLGCAHLDVPLDRSGATPGSVSLAIRRLRSPAGDGTSAVIALAGGPGQAAGPLAAAFAQILAPALGTRDLLVPDQRGTGASSPLSCPAFSQAAATATATQVLPACAQQLGAARGHFTTLDSVEDVESIRQALGYSKLVLYGTSYGTKVALDYALRYPTHVERLLLDSTVPPNGPDIFSRSSIGAVPRVLGELCARGACAGTTADPVGDLSRLVAQLRIRPAKGFVVDPVGHRRLIAVSHDDLLDILIAGDEDATLRAALPGAVHAAMSGDAAPLARLRFDALSRTGRSSGIDLPLYYATECEELPYPWTRGAAPATKLAQLTAAARAISPASLTPFDSLSALHSGPATDCAQWPQATSGAPALSGTLPAVPTLIFSGADDLRTPVEDAARVAAQIPGAQLVTVPNVGHSVIGTELGSCARDAIRAFFGGGAVQPCKPTLRPALLRPTPTPPRNLAAVRAGGGRARHALVAAGLTLQDAVREVELGLVNALSTGLPFNRVRSGGLRGGYAVFSAQGLILHGYSYVPGVRLTGRLRTKSRGSVRLSGKVHGRLRLGAHSTLSGMLGGRRVRARVRGLASADTGATIARGAHRPLWRTP